MDFYKIINGSRPTGDQFMANSLFSLRSAGQSTMRQLIDRSVEFSGDGGEFAEAYVDADGRLDSVDTGSTTALFNNDKYSQDFEIDTTETLETGSNTSTTDDAFTTTVSIINPGIFTAIRIFNTNDGTAGSINVSVTVKVNGVAVTPTKTAIGISDGDTGTINFIKSDYTKVLTPEDVVTIVYSDTTYPGRLAGIKTNYSYSGTNFTLSSQTVMAGASGNEYEFSTVSITSNTDLITHTIPSGTFSSTISNSFLTVNYDDYEEGASSVYKLTNTGGDDSGWLTPNELSSFTAFTAEPDTLQVKLVPKSSSPTAGYPSVRGVYLAGDF